MCCVLFSIARLSYLHALPSSTEHFAEKEKSYSSYGCAGHIAAAAGAKMQSGMEWSISTIFLPRIGWPSQGTNGEQEAALFCFCGTRRPSVNFQQQELDIVLIPSFSTSRASNCCFRDHPRHECIKL